MLDYKPDDGHKHEWEDIEVRVSDSLIWVTQEMCLLCGIVRDIESFKSDDSSNE